MRRRASTPAPCSRGRGRGSAAPHVGSALLVVLLAVASGCASGGKREAAQLVRAVDHYRQAPDASKSGEARTVADVACTDAKVCEAKRLCVAALDPTARALRLKEEVANRLRDLEEGRLSPEASEAQVLPAKLDEAEKLLREGRAKMPECERRLTDLSVDYGI